MTDSPPPISIVQQFRTTVRDRPDAIAVRDRGRAVTYAELDRAVDAVAAALHTAGITADAPVAILADRSLEMIIAVLAVHRAGGASMPLDVSHPPERLAHVLEIADCEMMLLSCTQLSALSNIRRLMVTVMIEDSMIASATKLPVRDPAPDQLAYIVFTSGSTGAPKGIAMPHRPLDHLIRWQLSSYHAPGDATTLSYASVIFDVFYQELYATLAGGGCLVIVPEATRADFHALCELMITHDVRRAYLPTVALRYLAAAIQAGAPLPALQEVVVAGEQLQITDAVRELFARLPAAALVNQYGPAETHVVTAEILRAPSSSWPALPGIGRALPSAPVQVLDRDLRPVPAGDVGELYFGGPCVSRGYIHRPELTAARFVPDPFSDGGSGGGRLYRTGDLARITPDGTIEFLGRQDCQLKIRGFRIELQEIEIALARHPAVRDAAVTVHVSADGEKSLAAYVVTATTPPPRPDELRQFLAESLPDYMVPVTIEPIAELPKTSTGKIDRRALPGARHSA